MANLNKVLLMGNLTRDPELRYLPSGQPVCKLGLAVNRKWRDNQSGEMKEQTCFVDASAFGRQGETIAKYMTKGRPIFIEGRLDFRSWEGQDGQKRSKLEVVVENFQFLGGRQEGGEGMTAAAGQGGSYGGGGGYGGNRGGGRSGGGAGYGGAAAGGNAEGNAGGDYQGGLDDDDIPF